MNFDSKLRFFKSWPQFSESLTSRSVLIYDRKLEKVAGPLIRAFPLRIALRAGEELKTFKQAEKYLAQLLKLTEDVSRSEVRVIALGGGSVGDFAGFCASLLRRGTKIIQIPSTWLAAMDSAHGGKTALNLSGAKNQVGTYWPAEEVWLIRKLLVAQPEKLSIDARGEVYKSAFIAGGSLFERVGKTNDLWALAPAVIKTKMKIVKQDPYETKGLRHQLNLGHSIGHVLEAQLGLSHGKAVLFGLAFMIEWQKHALRMKGQFADPAWMRKVQSWPGWPKPTELRQALSKVKNWERLLKSDKKSVGQGQLRFVIPVAPGRVKVEVRSVTEAVQEIGRQLE